ncbi:MAG: ATP-binding protein [Spirosomaceae bacterium]|jgi:signal transduction histidine kinase/DNA-binding response OmpR family regulator|nr:ATP-binding protein [Spirosomataceae bacterium]
MREFHQTIKILLFIVASLPVSAQTIVLTDSSTRNITQQLLFRSEENDNKTFDAIKKEKFSRLNSPDFNSPPSNKIYWFKIPLENTTDQKLKFVLECGYNRIEHNIFFIPDEKGNYQKIDKGLLEPMPHQFFHKSNSSPHIELTLMPHTSKTVYVKIYGSRNIVLRAYLYTPDAFLWHEIAQLIQNSILTGAMFIRLCITLILAFFAVKTILFRAYGFSLFMGFLLWGTALNMLAELFTPDAQLAVRINFIISNSYSFCLLLFAITALHFRQFPKILKITIVILMSLNILIGLYSIYDYQWYIVKISMNYAIFSWFLIIALYIYTIIKKQTVNWYLSIPFLLGNGSYILYQIINQNWFGSNVVWISAFLKILSLTDILCFGYFLGKIIQDYERTKGISEQQLVLEKEQNLRLAELDSIKTNFFANISHEFRTPLTLILAPAQDLVKGNPSNVAYQIIYRNANRLLELINQLLDITKIEAGQMNIELKKVNLSVYFRTLISSFTSLAQSKGITFEFSQNKNDAWANVDSDKIEKIIINLLSNSFKFTDSNKKVEVRVDYQPKQIVIHISDEGIGISEDKLDKIFDRFYQVESNTNRKFEGTGIGLALVKELVEVMKGQINVKSQEGLGTTFEVVLPIRYETQPTDVSTTEQISIRPSISNLLTENSLKVAESESEQILLIVDDNADIRTYIRGIFENEYRIIEAVDGKDGLAKANEQIPNLVISDLMMPEMDGFEFCKRMKTDEKTSHIPIIMLTAKANVESRIEGLGLGADDYLIKPFHKEEIEVRARNLISIRENLKKQFSKEIINLNPEEIKVNSIDAKFLNKIKEVVESNITNQRFDVEQFASAMNMSAVQLRRKMKSLTNFTVVEYVRNFRLQKAANLLKHKTASVSEIAYQVGFESLPYFSRVFQEHYGVPPSEYKPE